MNDNGFIDPKKPKPGQNDYRTSTYRGLIKMDEDIVPTRKERILFNITQAAGEELPRKSEQQVEFWKKSGDPYAARNPTIPNPKFIKIHDELNLRNAPKPIQKGPSHYRRDFSGKSKAYEEKSPDVHIVVPVEPVKTLCINPLKPGYGKYLNPSATTNSLTYLPYTPEELGIASKDNINLWNWNKEKRNAYVIKQVMCEQSPASLCPKRRREYQNIVKHVPHGGLSTETGSNYIKRTYNTIDISNLKYEFLCCTEFGLKAESENKIYGSGKRTENYI